MDVAWLLVDGSFAAAIAAVVVYFWLYGSRPADAPDPARGRGRRAMRVALAVALLVHAGVALLPAVDESRNASLRLEETETRLLQIEDIVQNYAKHTDEIVSDLASMLSKDPGNIQMSYNRARSSHENAKLMTEGDPKTDEEASPAAAAKHKPWRLFSIPPDHVFFLDCADDELTVHIRQLSAGSMEEMRVGTGCSSRQQAAAAPFLYDCGRHRTLYTSPPGEERSIPVPWPRAEMFQKVTAAALRGQESPVAEEEVVPESFKLGPGVAAFYQPVEEEGVTELLVVATDTVEFVQVPEQFARAVTPLAVPAILPASFPKST